ncbi:Protein spaetzle [Lucilia cuprina]|nr:Protein spaetzle [Lucilia cuprina]
MIICINIKENLTKCLVGITNIFVKQRFLLVYQYSMKVRKKSFNMKFQKFINNVLRKYNKFLNKNCIKIVKNILNTIGMVSTVKMLIKIYFKHLKITVNPVKIWKSRVCTFVTSYFFGQRRTKIKTLHVTIYVAFLKHLIYLEFILINIIRKFSKYELVITMWSHHFCQIFFKYEISKLNNNLFSKMCFEIICTKVDLNCAGKLRPLISISRCFLNDKKYFILLQATNFRHKVLTFWERVTFLHYLYNFTTQVVNRTTIATTNDRFVTSSEETTSGEGSESQSSIDESHCLEFDTVGNGKVFCNKLRSYPDISFLESKINDRLSMLESYFNPLLRDGEFLCSSRERTIYPVAAVNNEGTWTHIVNIPRYKQAINIEECTERGSTCGKSNEITVPANYTTKCRQSFADQILVAISEKKDIKLERFRIPTCCKCVLKLKGTYVRLFSFSIYNVFLPFCNVQSLILNPLIINKKTAMYDLQSFLNNSQLILYGCIVLFNFILLLICFCFKKMYLKIFYDIQRYNETILIMIWLYVVSIYNYVKCFSLKFFLQQHL